MRQAVLSLTLVLAACRGSSDPADMGSVEDLGRPADMRRRPDLGSPEDLAMPPVTRSLTPVPPTATSFGWQGLQRQFKDTDGSICNGAVTIAMGDQAVCFVA